MCSSDPGSKLPQLKPNLHGHRRAMMRKTFLMLLCSAAADEFLSLKRGISARCLLQGWADDAQESDIVKAAQDCFTRNEVQTSNLGELQGTLGVATGCVVSNLDAKWGWRPELAGSGSNTGGPYDVYGEGLTLVGVETPSGSWQFMLRKPSASQGGSSHVAVTVHSYHRGDATPQQERDLIHFADSCFSKEDVDTSNLGSLQFSLGKNVDCVLQKCLEAWGFKPESSSSGSDNGGPYDAYGLGATVIGVESPSGKWEFVLRLKN